MCLTPDPPQRAATLGQRGARGHDVVEQDHVPWPGDVGPGRKGATHVATTRQRAEFGLRRGTALAQQPGSLHRHPHRPRQRPRELKCLIVATGLQPLVVQGHRHDQFRPCGPWHLAQPQGRQNPSGGEVRAELEAGFQPVQRPAIAKRDPCRVPRWRPALALATQCGRLRQRQGATRAATTVARQLGGAVQAKVDAVSARATAKQAAIGQHETLQRILRRAPPRKRFHAPIPRFRSWV
jgi:hypothetical protein